MWLSQRAVSFVDFSSIVQLGLAFLVFFCEPASAHRIRAELDQGIVLSDGVRLSCDVYRPDVTGRFPVIVVRTPYGTSRTTGALFVKHGYVFVSVDVRGRYDSEGVFYPYRGEARDGAEVIAWAARQPWSDGQVATMGASYGGFAQLLAAGEAPPALKAMVVEASPADYYDSPARVGGAFNLGGRLPWVLMTHARTNQNLEAVDWQLGLRHLPLIEADMAATGRHLAAYRDWVIHSNKDQYWADFSMRQRWGAVKVPVRHLGGWYDEFLRGTLAAYSALRSHAANSSAREHQHLLIGPWTHNNFSFAQRVGEVDFGSASVLALDSEALRWFDWHLKGKSVGAAHRVRVFIMGSDRWAQFHDWPPPGKPTSWYLHSDGGANTRTGNGRLLTSLPKADRLDRYSYDPNHPVPTVGGATCCHAPGVYPEIMPMGPWDQRDVEMREDVLVYSTAPLRRAITVAGPVVVELFASSSAPDTDFTAKLVDVAPDGYARNLADGIIRARYRKSTEVAELLKPGQVYPFTIDLAATANTFKAGHQIRLEISSSNFPWYDRNLNTGGDMAYETQMKTAEQSVHHGVSRPSRLIMHVLDTALVTEQTSVQEREK